MKTAQPPTASSEAVGFSLIAIGDDRYPPLLREIHDPPPELYVRGDVAALAQPQFAIVGSRRASVAALRVTRLLASQLSQSGLSICSGLALGIDGAAHQGAIGCQGTTVAVTATGIDTIYPYRHRGLATEVTSSGCVVTEFPPGTPPRKGNFPQRNRIISGMSLGVLVVEAALQSGSLITARTANEQGREVFALPWSMLHEGGKGCLQLLRDGAKMVLDVHDIVDELGPLYSQHQRESQRSSDDVTALKQDAAEAGLGLPTSKNEALILALLGYDASALDELAQASGLPVNTVLSVLSGLEVSGRVARSDGGYVRV
ncbi:MAG: DNA-processing protein DprA [Halioglobus sp.]